MSQAMISCRTAPSCAQQGRVASSSRAAALRAAPITRSKLVAFRQNKLSNIAQKNSVVCMAESSTKTASPENKKKVATVEQQRVAAKMMTQYFKDKAYERDVEAARVLGWTYKAERSNGRWVMFGLLVGVLTEYATGVNFIDQVGITLSNLGILDMYD